MVNVHNSGVIILSHFDMRWFSLDCAATHGRSGNFGDVSIGFGVFKMIMFSSFHVVDFAYKSEESKSGNVATHFCSVGAKIINAAISGTEAFNERSIIHIGYEPSFEALAVLDRAVASRSNVGVVVDGLKAS
jgi:hypothetical protein